MRRTGCSGLRVKQHSDCLRPVDEIMTRNSLILVLVAAVVAALLRFVPAPIANFSALGALALLAGTVIRPIWLAMLIPLTCRAVTDLVLELKTGYGFHDDWMFVYGAYALICVMGRAVQPRGLKAPLGGVASAIVFFLVSNFGFWLVFAGGEGLYAKTFSGLLECYAAGLPFIRGTLAGNVLFSCVFFAALHFVEQSADAPATATKPRHGLANTPGGPYSPPRS